MPWDDILRGPWSIAEVRDHLDGSAIPLQLAFVRGDGAPGLASLWFLRDGETLWCATPGSSLLARSLRADARCSFQVASERPPYRGVRGPAVADVVPASAHEILQRLIGRYLGRDNPALAAWLLSRPNEVALAIRPTAIVSWDFTGRMESG